MTHIIMVGPRADQRNAQSAGRQALPLLERRIASETAKNGAMDIPAFPPSHG
jgi:hypothetical protein